MARGRDTRETSQTEKDLQMARGRNTGETSQTKKKGNCKWREVGILGRQVRQKKTCKWREVGILETRVEVNVSMCLSVARPHHGFPPDFSAFLTCLTCTRSLAMTDSVHRPPRTLNNSLTERSNATPDRSATVTKR